MLHDRRIPGKESNIDHLVISPAGVFIVDPKNYSGRVEQRNVGGWFKTDLRLYVGGRDRTKLIAGAQRQVEAVRAALDSTRWRDVRITPTICFVGDENWPLLMPRGLALEGVRVLWVRALGKMIRGPESLPSEEIEPLERELALALPPA